MLYYMAGLSSGFALVVAVRVIRTIWQHIEYQIYITQLTRILDESASSVSSK